ncbi:bZIP transcription factor [Hahella aquimaris]|uniref:bZIP transcription factor n=1 Tax=Hahella sp. HNIBRBA332 TaxID=3015983 RepID=UPI00273BB134|nr:bZIP transcription factor [Hahella sp. HNIBRBA332]WLQ15439.1 bZIP transcription factor [Hahella sp. HNIBRBA332]
MFQQFITNNNLTPISNYEREAVEKEKKRLASDEFSELEKKNAELEARNAELETSNRELTGLLMDQMRSNSSLGNVITLFENCSHEIDPLNIASHIQESLTVFDTEYCFLINWPEQYYIYSHDGYITDLQAKIITHLTLQKDRIIRFNHKTLINYPYFSLCLTSLDDNKLDDLTRLSQVCDYIIENLAKSSQEKVVKRRLSQKALSDTIELLDNILDLETACNNCTIDCFSDFRWTIQSSIIGMDLAPEEESRITHVLEQLLEQFEERQVSSRTIDKYLRRAKCTLMNIDSESSSEQLESFIGSNI